MPIIHTDGTALRYREFGGAANPPIVFAHSLLSSGDSFSEVLAELANNFHLVIPDIHGHGVSGYRNGMTLEEMTEDFYLLLKQLGFQKVVWFGCSMGWLIGMRLALAHPEVLDALVLLSTNRGWIQQRLRKRRCTYGNSFVTDTGKTLPMLR